MESGGEKGDFAKRARGDAEHFLCPLRQLHPTLSAEQAVDPELDMK